MRFAGLTVDLDALARDGDIITAPLHPGESRAGQWVKIPGRWTRCPERIAAVYQPGHQPLASVPLGPPEPTTGVVRRMHIRGARAALQGNVVRARAVPVLPGPGLEFLAAHRRVDIVGALVLTYPRGELRLWIHDLVTVRRWRG